MVSNQELILASMRAKEEGKVTLPWMLRLLWYQLHVDPEQP